QIGKNTKLFSQPQQSSFRAKRPRIMIECRPSNRSQQHRAGSQTSLHRIDRKRIVARQKRSSADFSFCNRKLMPKSVSYSLKHTDSLLRDLGPNTVAGQSCNFDEHQKLTSVIPKSPAESERERDL